MGQVFSWKMGKSRVQRAGLLVKAKVHLGRHHEEVRLGEGDGFRPQFCGLYEAYEGVS